LLASVPALALAVATPAAPPPHLRMLVENTSPPFCFRDDQGRPTGFVIELINAIGADQGFTVEPDLRPWQEIYPEFASGQGDILGLVARSEERAARMDFSAPFETMRCTFYVAAARGPDAVRGPGDLKGRRIGVIQDSIVDEFARRQDWHATLVRFSSLAAALAATRNGEIDATLSMQFVTDFLIRSRNVEGLVRANYFPPGLGYSLCFAVQRGNKDLLARINAGLLNVHRRGTYDWLYEKWLGPMEPRRLRWADVQLYLLPVALVAVAALGGLVWQRKLLVRLSRQAREIKESEERLQLVFEGSRDGFWDWNVDAGRVTRSPQWFRLLDYAPGEIAETSEAFHALIHPDDLPGILEHEQQIWRGEDHFTVEFRMKAKDGEWKWILDRGKVVARDPLSGRPRRIAGTHTDVTARKQAEEEAEKLRQKMQEAQKLESLGVLAGGIAHDFNNLLTVILGNCSLARIELDESSANRARLDSVVTSVNRAAELCRQLLAYAGKGSYHLERINLNELITETTRLLELSINKQAGLEFVLAPTLPKIEADPSQIRQVIMNLVINASEAVAGRDGVIRVATGVVALPLAGGPAALKDLDAGQHVCVEVTDTGCGMTPEVTARIFDPFFSTKFTGRGLGLAAVQGIVRTHRGALTVESTPGEGSTFKVYLPVSQTQTVHPFAADSAAAGA